jgi:TrpR family trp operon transcriptional repressor
MFHKGFDRAAVVGYLSPMAFEGSRDDTGHEIQEVFARITDVSQMISFFEEIFTSREIKDLELRWRLLKELHEGSSQRSIASRYGISLCKITRGSRILKRQGSTSRKILDAMYGSKVKSHGKT